MTTSAQGDLWPGLPDVVKARSLPVRDLDVHILEVGDVSKPLILLFHGFPELAYSWRAISPPLAQNGYHVVAPDLRGFGRTSLTTAKGGQDEQRPSIVRYEDDISPWCVLNFVQDAVALVFALGHTSVACVVGHDAGAMVAGSAALARPDLFRTVVLMSVPYPGAPSLPFAVDRTIPTSSPTAAMAAAALYGGLAQLDPPKQYYMHYFSGPSANADMVNAPDGLHSFLRAYFHVKSADWAGNDPHPLAPSAVGLAVLPPYYVMPRGATMPEAVRADAPSDAEVKEKSSRWMPDEMLGVYVREYGRTGFQGGLNWYRATLEEMAGRDWGARLFAGKKIEVPAMFLSGRKDWGVYQNPGALERMQKEVCTRMDEEDVVLVEGGGHWVQQEQPEEVVRHIVRFMNKHGATA